MQLADLAAHAHARRRVEVGERFVEQKDLRFARDRPTHGHALPPTAGKRLGTTGRKLLRTRDAGGLGDALGDRLLGATARTRGALSSTVSPAIFSVPDEIFSKPPIERDRVDLPQPDGPTKATKARSGMSSVMFLSTRTGP